MTPSKNLTSRPATLPRRALTSVEFSQLEDVPPETEWFANIDNPHTRRAYRNDLKEFMAFTGIRTPIELRLVTRAHVIAQGLWTMGSRRWISNRHKQKEVHMIELQGISPIPLDISFRTTPIRPYEPK